MEYPGMINSSSDKKEKCTLWEEDYLATKKKKKKKKPTKQTKNPHKTDSKRILCRKERKAHLMET